jgi:DNA-binding MarR family transcriptional regulator
MQQKSIRAAAHRAIAQLQRLTELFGQRRQRLAAESGLSEQQWRLLEEISTEHFIPSMFARDRDTSRPAVSKVIRQLIDKKLVSVSLCHHDGRHHKYVLTADGKRKLEKLRTLRERAIDAIWMRFDPDTLESFSDLSALVIDHIEKYDRSEKQKE